MRAIPLKSALLATVLGITAGAGALVTPASASTPAMAGSVATPITAAFTTSTPAAATTPSRFPDQLAVRSDVQVVPLSDSGKVAAATPDASTAFAADGTTITTVAGAAQLVGFRWTRGQALPAGVQIRTHIAGTWGAWTAVEAADASPDADSPEGKRVQPSAEPIWVGAADQIQVRHTTALPAGFELMKVRTPQTQADVQMTASANADAVQATPQATAVTMAGPARPFWFTRAQWGVNEAAKPPGCETPSYNDKVKAIFVHHTADANGYAASAVPSILRSIFAYQTANGYCDIAYHALIDRFGQIWEGRAGGMDRAVLGGATGGFNVDTWAISLIGNYGLVHVPGNSYAALRDLIAWKAFNNQLNAVGTTTLKESSNGPSVGAKWPAGTIVGFNVISGHRDAVNTACPGNYAYALLPQLRHDVDVKMAANPVGAVDSLTSGFRSVTARGWSIDPETASSWYVWMTVERGSGGPYLANSSRPDVGRAYPGKGNNHGFVATRKNLFPGVHRVCMWANNYGAGRDTPLGCRVAAVSANPVGSLDSVTGTSGGINVSGWTLDPETSQPIYAWITVSGRPAATLANRSRPDVGAAYPGYGSAHGFAGKISAAPGTYSVCAWGVNVKNGSDTPLGCRTARAR